MVRWDPKAYGRHSSMQQAWARELIARLDFHGEFDTVFSNAALHWVRDHGPVLRGIRESLKPGGRFNLSMGGRGNDYRHGGPAAFEKLVF